MVPTFSILDELISQLAPNHHSRGHIGSPSIQELLINGINQQGQGQPINLRQIISSPNSPPWLKRKLKLIQRGLIGPNILRKINAAIRQKIIESLIDITRDPRFQFLTDRNRENPLGNILPIDGGLETLNTGLPPSNDYDNSQWSSNAYSVPNAWKENENVNYLPSYKTNVDKSTDGWYKQRKPIDLTKILPPPVR